MNYRVLYKIVLLSLLIFLPLAFSGAAGVNEMNVLDDSAQTEKIMAYISGPATMLQELEQAFEKDRGDVLDIVALGCGPLRQRVWTEYETGGILCDVFWGSDPLVYIALDAKGALQDYTPKGIEALKPEFLTDGNYTLVNERYGVILYNTSLIEDDNIPKGFSDLAKPAFDQTIVLADPQQSSTALALVSTLFDLKGRTWDFHKSLIDNHLYLTKKNSDVPSKIMSREFLLGIAPHDEALRLQKKAKKEGYPSELGIVWPQEGALAIQRPIAISKKEGRTEAQQKLSEQFVDFMISQKAQEITVKYAFVSVRSDVPLPQGVPSNCKVHQVDWKYLSEHQDTIRTQFNALF